MILSFVVKKKLVDFFGNLKMNRYSEVYFRDNCLVLMLIGIVNRIIIIKYFKILYIYFENDFFM